MLLVTPTDPLCLSSHSLTDPLYIWRDEHSYFRIFGHPYTGHKNTAWLYVSTNILKGVIIKIANSLLSLYTSMAELVAFTQICLGPYIDTHIYTHTHICTYNQFTTIHMYTDARKYIHTYKYLHSPYITINSYLTFLLRNFIVRIL